MNTLIVQADSRATKVLIAIYKALNLTYVIDKEASKEESTYDPEFVKMVLKAKSGKLRIPYDKEYKKKMFLDT
ncbi:MAG: hypothetical protein ACK5UE_01965 [Chitinophagales bacterium]|jgi:hypothetical protein|nr:hypothetical protein [Sphingobacteriales bacterium]